MGSIPVAAWASKGAISGPYHIKEGVADENSNLSRSLRAINPPNSLCRKYGKLVARSYSVYCLHSWCEDTHASARWFLSSIKEYFWSQVRVQSRQIKKGNKSCLFLTKWVASLYQVPERRSTNLVQFMAIRIAILYQLTKRRATIRVQFLQVSERRATILVQFLAKSVSPTNPHDD
jgi:hypothetical protein